MAVERIDLGYNNSNTDDPRRIIYSQIKDYGVVNLDTGNYHPPTLIPDVLNSGAIISYPVKALIDVSCIHAVKSKDLV